jgi:hypothetical protein
MAFEKQPRTIQATGQIGAPLKNCSGSEWLLSKARKAIVLAIHENFMREA